MSRLSDFANRSFRLDSVEEAEDISIEEDEYELLDGEEDEDEEEDDEE